MLKINEQGTRSSWDLVNLSPDLEALRLLYESCHLYLIVTFRLDVDFARCCWRNLCKLLFSFPDLKTTIARPHLNVIFVCVVWFCLSTAPPCYLFIDLWHCTTISSWGTSSSKSRNVWQQQTLHHGGLLWNICLNYMSSYFTYYSCIKILCAKLWPCYNC